VEQIDLRSGLHFNSSSSEDVHFGATFYIFCENGTIAIAANSTFNESMSVQVGDLKFSTFVENWPFCSGENSCLDTTICVDQFGQDEFGSYLDVALSIKTGGMPSLVEQPSGLLHMGGGQGGESGEQGGPKWGTGVQYDFSGDTSMVFSQAIKVDGVWLDMGNNYPTYTPSGFQNGVSTSLFGLRFPKFLSEAIYDPTISLGESLEDTAAPTTVFPSTVEPSTSKPTTMQPTTAHPITVLPTTMVPDAALPTTADPTTVQPTTVEPTTLQPTTTEPTTAQPTTAQPTTIQPTSTKPTTLIGSNAEACFSIESFALAQVGDRDRINEELIVKLGHKIECGIYTLSMQSVSSSIYNGPKIQTSCAIGERVPIQLIERDSCNDESHMVFLDCEETEGTQPYKVILQPEDVTYVNSLCDSDCVGVQGCISARDPVGEIGVEICSDYEHCGEECGAQEEKETESEYEIRYSVSLSSCDVPLPPSCYDEPFALPESISCHGPVEDYLDTATEVSFAGTYNKVYILLHASSFILSTLCVHFGLFG